MDLTNPRALLQLCRKCGSLLHTRCCRFLMMFCTAILFTANFSTADNLKPESILPMLHRDSSPPTDTAARGEVLLRELSDQIVHYGPCWQRAVNLLHSTCTRLTENGQHRLALAFTSCFVQKLGHPGYTCDDTPINTKIPSDDIESENTSGADVKEGGSDIKKGADSIRKQARKDSHRRSCKIKHPARNSWSFVGGQAKGTRIEGEPVAGFLDASPLIRCPAFQRLASGPHLSTYSTFFTHTQVVCAFLQQQRWQQTTLDVVNALTLSAANVSYRLTSLAGSLAGTRADHQRMQRLTQQALRASGELALKISAQRSSLDVLLEQLHHANAAIIGHVTALTSFGYFLACVFASFLLTAVDQTRRARPWLLMLATVNFVTELAIVQWALAGHDTSVHDKASHKLEAVASRLTLCRRVSFVVSIALYLFKVFTYKSVEQQMLSVVRATATAVFELHSRLDRVEEMLATRSSQNLQPRRMCDNLAVDIALPSKGHSAGQLHSNPSNRPLRAVDGQGIRQSKWLVLPSSFMSTATALINRRLERPSQRSTLLRSPANFIETGECRGSQKSAEHALRERRRNSHATHTESRATYSEKGRRNHSALNVSDTQNFDHFSRFSEMDAGGSKMASVARQTLVGSSCYVIDGVDAGCVPVKSTLNSTSKCAVDKKKSELYNLLNADAVIVKKNENAKCKTGSRTDGSNCEHASKSGFYGACNNGKINFTINRCRSITSQTAEKLSSKHSVVRPARRGGRLRPLVQRIVASSHVFSTSSTNLETTSSVNSNTNRIVLTREDAASLGGTPAFKPITRSVMLQEAACVKRNSSLQHERSDLAVGSIATLKPAVNPDDKSLRRSSRIRSPL